MLNRHNNGEITRRRLLAAGAAAGGALVLPRSLRAKPRRGGTLHVAMPYNPTALDPATGRNTPDFNTLYTLYDALIDFDPETLDLKPGLAKAWRFTDPKTLVLDVIDGVEFHDGTPFNAEAVKVNLERYKQALEIPQFIAPAVSIMSPKVKNFAAGILNCPKLAEVWLEA
jgi:ABC-type transport system substrate-binding protein